MGSVGIEDQQASQARNIHNGGKLRLGRYLNRDDRVVELHGRRPFRTHKIPVAGIDHHFVGIHARSLQQCAHQGGLVLAVAVISGQSLSGRPWNISAAMHDVQIHRDVVGLLHEGRDGADLIEFGFGMTDQFIALGMDCRRGFRRRVRKSRLPCGDAAPVLQGNQVGLAAAGREICDAQSWRH